MSCTLQVKWFTIDNAYNPKTKTTVRVPLGNLCNCCGALCEAWPEFTPTEICVKLTDDLVFAFWWDVAKKRHQHNEPATWNMVSVSKKVISGLRAPTVNKYRGALDCTLIVMSLETSNRVPHLGSCVCYPFTVEPRMYTLSSGLRHDPTQRPYLP